MSSDNLYIKLNDFHSSMRLSFEEIRADQDFTDITLVGEGNLRVKAHKVILASSSGFFKDFFMENNHPHPLLYMRGILTGHLRAMMNFMYYGEVWIPKEDLDEFLCLAKELDIKVLDGQPRVKEQEYKSFNLLAEPQEKYLFHDSEGERVDIVIKHRTNNIIQ